LRHETSLDQLHTVLAGIHDHLNNHASVDSDSLRVRFSRLGAYSLDVDVFTYVFASDWNGFLQIQEELLFDPQWPSKTGQ
jgi:MscS family membrane protein